MISSIEIIDWLSRSLYLCWSRFPSMIFSLFSFHFSLISLLISTALSFLFLFAFLDISPSCFFPIIIIYIITIFLFPSINQSYLIKLNYGTYITFLQEPMYSRFKYVNSVHSNYISSVLFTFYIYVHTSV